MGTVAGGRLAAAVSNAGGIGLIGGGYGDAEWIAAEFDEAGDTAVGCGLITWAIERSPAVLDRVLERQPRAVMLSFGDPRPFGVRVRAAGVTLMCQVNNRLDTMLALEAGAEVVVAQGAEAGGHGEHRRSSFPLVPELADLIRQESPDTLLCAAGGISDGRGLAAMLILGADGVMLGTRFCATEEAKIGSGQQRATLQANGDATVLSTSLDIARQLDWPARYSCRVLANEFTDTWHGRDDELRATNGEIGEEWKQAYAAGDADRSNTLVGEGVGLIHDITPARDVIERIVEDASILLGPTQVETKRA